MDSYSASEAKVRFKEILRKVRNGQRVEITYRGEIVAEIRPASQCQSTLSARIAQFERDGRVSPSRTGAAFVPLANRPGALSRFLQYRD